MLLLLPVLSSQRVHEQGKCNECEWVYKTTIVIIVIIVVIALWGEGIHYCFRYEVPFAELSLTLLVIPRMSPCVLESFNNGALM
jgi:hypothetical protein